jgi:hypothetical protein
MGPCWHPRDFVDIHKGVVGGKTSSRKRPWGSQSPRKEEKRVWVRRGGRGKKEDGG